MLSIRTSDQDKYVGEKIKQNNGDKKYWRQ